MALSFGESNPSGGVGKSNCQLAKIANGFYQRLRLPLLLQVQVADALPKQMTDPIVIVIGSKCYLNTRDVLLRMQEQLSRLSVVEVDVILVVHPAHWWRVYYTAKRLGLGVVFTADTIGVPYDSNNQQLWVRNKFAWVVREIPTRLYFWKQGWLDLSSF